MNLCFKNYYEKLYESESHPDLDVVHTFFSNMGLPSLWEADKNDLEEYVTEKEIITAQSMPTRTAAITTIPQHGKDATQMSNYRPLSLLNNDFNIFAKIRVLHLGKVAPSLLHSNQVGFVKGCHASSNIKRLFQVIQRATSLQHPATLLSLFAEKAFDRVEWPYLFYTLQRYGFGLL